MPPTTATEAGVLIPVPAVQPVSFKPDTAQIPEPKTDPLLPPTAAPNKKATPESGPLAPQTPDTTPAAHSDLAPSTEPPLAPNSTGPVQTYHVRGGGETMRDIAKRTLGTPDRWQEIHRLNPIFKPESALAAGAVVKVPADACLPNDEVEAVRPLPAMRPRSAPAKPKVVAPLTGTYPTNLDDKKAMTLPKALREQLGGESVLVTPGPDECLWITDQTHLDRLAEKLEHSAAREADVRVFKRLYYAQTEKAALDADGRVTVPERLAQFAGLHQEVVLIGIDDHFELWDAAKWRQYTQVKSAAAKALVAEGE
jgi:MraZ protein